EHDALHGSHYRATAVFVCRREDRSENDPRDPRPERPGAKAWLLLEGTRLGLPFLVEEVLMRAPRWVSSTALVLLLGIPAAASAAPITIGQIDTFEDGTTQGWQINLLGMGTPLLPVPANIPTGGPAGSGDNFLEMVSTGIPMTAGNRMTVLNAAQWAGDYLAGGVTAISMDVANFGPTDVNLRLLFEDAMGGPPSNVAVSTNSILLPAF